MFRNKWKGLGVYIEVEGKRRKLGEKVKVGGEGESRRKGTQGGVNSEVAKGDESNKIITRNAEEKCEGTTGWDVHIYHKRASSVLHVSAVLLVVLEIQKQQCNFEKLFLFSVALYSRILRQSFDQSFQYTISRYRIQRLFCEISWFPPNQLGECFMT